LAARHTDIQLGSEIHKEADIQICRHTYNIIIMIIIIIHYIIIIITMLLIIYDVIILAIIIMYTI